MIDVIIRSVASSLLLPLGPRLVSGLGLQGPNNQAESMRIHQENQAKLQAMSQADILEEQKKVLAQLGRHCYHNNDCIGGSHWFLSDH